EQHGHRRFATVRRRVDREPDRRSARAALRGRAEGGRRIRTGPVRAAEGDRMAVNSVGPPMGLLAELTHRCPLHCPYCSNPLELIGRSDELDADAWRDVLTQARELGCCRSTSPVVSRWPGRICRSWSRTRPTSAATSTW